MNILVVGCGKVGLNLASVLARQGHDVSVIDRNQENLDLLPNDFNGFTTVGVPIDQEILKKAGIESVDAVAAVTPNDNVNIMVCELAKTIFKINKVFLRIYDPKREEFFSHLGMYTVCPTNLTVAAICSALNDSTETYTLNIGTKTIQFTKIDIPKAFIGLNVNEIDYEENETLYAVERRPGELLLIGLSNITLEKNDKLIFSKIID